MEVPANAERSDGFVRSPEYNQSPVRNRKGEIVGASKIARDITERKRMEQALQGFDRQLMLLTEASSALLASPQTSDVLRTIVELAQHFGSADGYAVWRESEDDV